MSFNSSPLSADGTSVFSSGGGSVASATTIGTTAASAISLGNVSRSLTVSGTSVSFSGLTLNPAASIAAGAGRILGQPHVAVFSLTSETGAVAVSTTPATWFRFPFPVRIIGVRGYLYTAGGSQTTVDIRTVASGVTIPTSIAGGTSIFTTALTLATSRFSSVEAGNTAYALTTAASTTGYSDDQGFAIFVSNAGTSAAGLKVMVYYTVF
jgi:hypothetical protein